MTVRRMIKQLLDYPMDSQVVDTDGSPIMYMLFHSRETNSVRLEPKNQMDMYEELNALFQSAMECADTDRDTYEELIELGYTAEDMLTYSKTTYEWFMRMKAEDEE